MVRRSWAKRPKRSCRVGNQSTSLVLASSSPRRQQLLTDAGIDFEVLIPDVDEQAIGQDILDAGGTPTDYVTALAEAKVVSTSINLNKVSGTRADSHSRESAVRSIPGTGSSGEARSGQFPGTVLCLAADTVVVHRGKILGKPSNRNDARATLLSMSGGSVDVLTAVALFDGGAGDGGATEVRVVTTTLKVRPLSPAEVHGYVATGAADDKAGSLAVQDDARDFIVNIDGCFSNVVGLPMCEVADVIRRAETGDLSRREPEPHQAPECLCPTMS